MKRVYIFLTALAVAAFAATSCMQDDFDSRVSLAEQNGGLAVSLACEPLPDEVDTKSANFTNESKLTKATDVNYYVFDRTTGKFISQEYISNASNLSVVLPDYRQSYKVFFLANVGDKLIEDGLLDDYFGADTQLEDVTADDMAGLIKVSYGSYSNYLSTIQTKGFPLAGIVEDFNAGNSSHVTLKRLVHTLRVKINTEALSASELTVKNIRVRQAARDVHPFMSKSKCTSVLTADDATNGADYLSASDIASIAYDGSNDNISLYMLENMRGDLIEGITDWREKVPQNINNMSERAVATYIEIETAVTTPTAEYDNVVYRAYLGKSASNFDVERSTVFTLTNTFTNDMVPDEEWRVEADAPTITGKLEFTEPLNDRDQASYLYNFYKPEDEYVDFVNNPLHMVPGGEPLSQKFFYLTDGFQQTYFIYRSNKDIKYNISLSQSSDVRPYLTCVAEDYNDNYIKVTIKSCKKETYRDDVDLRGHHYLSNGDVTGVDYRSNVPRKVYPVTITLKSDDGLLSDQITCRYYYGTHEACFRWNESGVGSIMMGNPMGLHFTFSSAGRVGFFYNGFDFAFSYPGLNEDGKNFLRYIGAGWTTDDGKYGHGKQDNAYRWVPMLFSNSFFANVEAAAAISFFFTPITLGASAVGFMTWFGLDNALGTIHHFYPSVAAVPYETEYSSGVPSGGFYTLIEDPTPVSYSGYSGWLNYDYSILNWKHNKSIGDVLSSYTGVEGAIYASTTFNTYYRYACPYFVESHVDMFLGRFCSDDDRFIYVNGNSPLSVISYNAGLSLDVNYFSIDEIDENSYITLASVREKEKSFVKDLVYDVTFRENRSDPYIISSVFNSHDYPDGKFTIKRSELLPYSDVPHFLSGSSAEMISSLIGRDVFVSGVRDTDYLSAGEAEMIFKYFTRMPSDFSFTFNKEAEMTPIIKSLNKRAWSWLSEADNHFMSFTLNDYYDYLTE